MVIAVTGEKGYRVKVRDIEHSISNYGTVTYQADCPTKISSGRESTKNWYGLFEQL